MKKINAFFKWLGKLIVTPLMAIVTIPISDRFISFMNKHAWIRIFISGLIAGAILFFVYYLRG